MGRLDQRPDRVDPEPEGLFRDAGWNVLEVVWGSDCAELLAAGAEGLLVERMNATLDGGFQEHAVEGGGHLRITHCPCRELPR